MKKYCLLLLFITLTILGCGELKDPYANLKGSGGSSSGGTGGANDNTPTSGTNNIPVPSPNNGADAIVMAMPSTKTQTDYEKIETFFVKISESKTSSSYQAPNLEDDEEYLLPQMNVSAIPDFHTSLRIKEKELLKNLPADYFTNQYRYRSLKATTPPTIGSKRTFFVDKSISGVSRVEAEYVGESDHAYLYIPSALKGQLIGNIDKYKTGFEKSYNLITTKFGPESDIDGNGKVIILFFEMALEPNVIGYFFGGDQISGYPESNIADIFYMNTRFLSAPDTILATLSHEFQHMTYFNNMVSNPSYDPLNFDGDSWMNEGLSMLSSDLCGDAGIGSTNYNWIGNFLSASHRNLSLTNWSNNSYGYSAIFNYYIYQFLGGDSAIKKIYDSGFGGIKAVEAAANGKDFNEIFTDFVDAVYNNKITRINDYGFTNSDRNGLSYAATLQREKTVSFNIPAYGFSLIKVGYPISSLTFSHNGNITGKAYPLN